MKNTYMCLVVLGLLAGCRDRAGLERDTPVSSLPTFQGYTGEGTSTGRLLTIDQLQRHDTGSDCSAGGVAREVLDVDL